MKQALPTLLALRMRQWEIHGISFQPQDNNVVLWRLPSIKQTGAGLWIPDDNQSPHVKGIVLAMGPRAADTLRSNGVDIGHTVLFERFAGWELKDMVEDRQMGDEILIVKDKAIIGSEEVQKLIAAGLATYEKGTDGRYVYRLGKISERRYLTTCIGKKDLHAIEAGGTGPSPRAPKAIPAAKRKKLLALAASTPFAAEAETARRLADAGRVKKAGKSMANGRIAKLSNSY